MPAELLHGSVTPQSGVGGGGSTAATPASIGAVPVSEKGAAGGVASLGLDGKIPAIQLPAQAVGIPQAEKGASNGVALLDFYGKIVTSQLPTFASSLISDKGAASGVASLGSDGKVPTDQLPDTALSSDIPLTQKGSANGVATLGSDGKVPAVQLPAVTPAIPLADKGVAGGVATLGASAQLPVSQLPTHTSILLTDRGVADGVATLDSSAKLPVAQLPSHASSLLTDKGVANGVATLGADGKVPTSQLPAVSGAIPTAEKGAASGVATLDAATKLPVAQLPTHSSSLLSDKGAASGVASLDASAKLPTAQLPTLTSSLLSDKAAANGVASLDANAKVPVAQIPAITSTLISDKGSANGVASLDANGRVPSGQLPASATSSDIPLAQRGTANGVATLDASLKIPVAQLPTHASSLLSDKGQANGVASLDGSSKLPVAQLPAHTSTLLTDRGAAGGVASLAADGKVPTAQLPDSALSVDVPLSQKGAAGGVAAVDAFNILNAVHWPADLAQLLADYRNGTLGAARLFSIDNMPPGTWRPFNVNSPWNIPVPANPTLHANSAAMVTWLNGLGGPIDLKLIDTVNGPQNDYGHPTYYSSDSDPLYTLNITANWGYDAVPNGTQIRIPSTAKPAGGSDMHMNIVDQKANKIYSLFNVTNKPVGGGTLTCLSAGASLIDGSGITPGGIGYAGGTAASFNGLAGIIRAEEMIAGEINHALFCVTSYNKAEFVWPATWYGTTNAGCPVPSGARFYLDYTIPEINALAVPDWKKTILRAMARYGMIVGDTTANSSMRWEILFESPQTYTSMGKVSPLNAFATAAGISYIPDPGFQWRFPLASGVDWTRLKVLHPDVCRVF